MLEGRINDRGWGKVAFARVETIDLDLRNEMVDVGVGRA